MSNVNHKTPRQRMVERIQATKIMKRVSDCALGKDEMTTTELSAAKICLAKVVPDLKQTEHTGDVGVEITKVVRTIVRPEPTNS